MMAKDWNMTATCFDPRPSNCVSYHNGNYTVTLSLADGTMIRYSQDDKLVPSFPDSMDIKITNCCSLNCRYCHEKSTKDGLHGDILSDSFIDKLHPYTSLAVGGGNVLEHPDLVPFLKKCKELKLVPSITVNQIHFMQQHKFLKQLTDEKLIYGLGISFHHPDKNFLPILRSFPNAVIHTIAGITKERDYEFLADNGLKVLILGYKKFGRGIQAYQESHQHIDYSIMNLKHLLPHMVKEKWFDSISFDNLALKQLDVKNLMPQDKWDMFYMGDEGSSTMYVDMVNREFAANSTSETRYPLLDNVEDMLNVIHQEKKGKDID